MQTTITDRLTEAVRQAAAAHDAAQEATEKARRALHDAQTALTVARYELDRCTALEAAAFHTWSALAHFHHDVTVTE